MKQWVYENISLLAILVIVGIGYLISYDVWCSGYSLSLIVAGVCLALLAYISISSVSFLERLILIAAYLWICWQAILIFASIYSQFGINGAENTKENTIHLSISIWTLLGFGPVTPTEASRYWVQIEAIYGLLSNGVLVALLIRLLTPWQHLAKEH